MGTGKVGDNYDGFNQQEHDQKLSELDRARNQGRVVIRHVQAEELGFPTTFPRSIFPKREQIPHEKRGELPEGVPRRATRNVQSRRPNPVPQGARPTSPKTAPKAAVRPRGIDLPGSEDELLDVLFQHLEKHSPSDLRFAPCLERLMEYHTHASTFSRDEFGKIQRVAVKEIETSLDEVLAKHPDALPELIVETIADQSPSASRCLEWLVHFELQRRARQLPEAVQFRIFQDWGRALTLGQSPATEVPRDCFVGFDIQPALVRSLHAEYQYIWGFLVDDVLKVFEQYKCHPNDVQARLDQLYDSHPPRDRLRVRPGNGVIWRVSTVILFSKIADWLSSAKTDGSHEPGGLVHDLEGALSHEQFEDWERVWITEIKEEYEDWLLAVSHLDDRTIRLSERFGLIELANKIGAETRLEPGWILDLMQRMYHELNPDRRKCIAALMRSASKGQSNNHEWQAVLVGATELPVWLLELCAGIGIV